MKRACTYARVSTKQQEVKSTSIAAQLRLCREYAQAHDLEIVAEYIETRSGRVERKKFNQMLEDAKNKQFEVVLVWKFNRFSRNQETSIVKKHILLNSGVDVISITQPVDRMNIASRLAEKVTEIFDEHFSENLAQDTLRGQLEKTRQGLQMGVIPWGYTKVDGALVFSDDANKVRYAFEQFATGKYTLDQWVEESYKLGYRIKSGKKIPKARWHHTFRNVIYSGKVKWANVVHDGKHEALISFETFEKVQQLLTERGHKQVIRRDYPLVGYLWSIDAESHMIGTCGTGSSGKSVRYYQSVKKLPNGKRHYVNADKLEKNLDMYLLKIGVKDKMAVDVLPSIDDQLKLALKVTPTVGNLWCYLDLSQQKQLINLMINNYGLHVRGHNLTEANLKSPFFCYISSDKSERHIKDTNFYFLETK